MLPWSLGVHVLRGQSHVERRQLLTPAVAYSTPSVTNWLIARRSLNIIVCIWYYRKRWVMYASPSREGRWLNSLASVTSISTAPIFPSICQSRCCCCCCCCIRRHHSHVHIWYRRCDVALSETRRSREGLSILNLVNVHCVPEKSKPKSFCRVFYKPWPILIKFVARCLSWICLKVM